MSDSALAPTDGAPNYAAFLARKSQEGAADGFTPLWLPDFLFDFQRALVEWAIRRGRAAIFADTGLGKTPMSLVWAENVVRQTNRSVLIFTPLAVGAQFEREAEKFGVEAKRVREGRVRPGINIANYERLHYFSPDDFAGVVCDESSITKHFGGATQKRLTRFLAKVPYRLFCSATPAPNDYHELGTSSEALGGLGKSEMLSRFFAQDDGKRFRMNEVKLARAARTGRHYAKLAYRVSQQIGQWRLKAHAEVPFWRWVCSWARACRSPSDLGYADNGFRLPSLLERHRVVVPSRPKDGLLLTVPAFGLREEREERRRTLEERAALVAHLVERDDFAVIWVHLNIEGDRLATLIPGAIQVKGSDSLDQKEERLDAFSSGRVRVLITKPTIAGFGLNWQHCAHVVTFASHSFEQYYQSIRRCWRYGQTRDVTVDIISTEGEVRVRENMDRKANAADVMFSKLVGQMNDALRIEGDSGGQPVEAPPWL